MPPTPNPITTVTSYERSSQYTYKHCNDALLVCQACSLEFEVQQNGIHTGKSVIQSLHKPFQVEAHNTKSSVYKLHVCNVARYPLEFITR